MIGKAKLPVSKWCSDFMPTPSWKRSKLVVLFGTSAKSFQEGACLFSEKTTKWRHFRLETVAASGTEMCFLMNLQGV